MFCSVSKIPQSLYRGKFHMSHLSRGDNRGVLKTHKGSYTPYSDEELITSLSYNSLNPPFTRSKFHMFLNQGGVNSIIFHSLQYSPISQRRSSRERLSQDQDHSGWHPENPACHRNAKSRCGRLWLRRV